MTGGFRKLSNQATPGPWERYGLNAIGSVPERTCVVLTQNTVDDQRRDDADFIVALVNAYRAGQLIEAPQMQTGRWWRVIGPDGSLWCETSVEGEARSALRTAAAGHRLQRLYRAELAEWRDADSPAASLVGSLNETPEAEK